MFVECIRGDLTIKVEDNTATGEGIYSERVEDRHQKVDDAAITYAIIDPLVLLAIRPYKETRTRYFIFHSKLQTVHRVDAIGDSYGLLPEEQGLIFTDGYYLATGELKQFESRETGRITIAQFPNWPLWAIAAGWVVGAVAPSESAVADAAHLAVVALWLVWAGDELIRGVNPWRRVLGAAVIVGQVVRLVG